MAKIKKSNTSAYRLYGSKNPTDTEKLEFWKSKYEDSIAAYRPEIDKCQTEWEYYIGTKGIPTKIGEQEVKNTRKLCFEMVESQINTAIPLPKAVSLTGNHQRAEVIERVLTNARFRLPFAENNDYNSRVTLVNGSSFFYVYWDHNARTHDSVGNLKVKTIDPKNVIPQVGIYDIDQMDYIFLREEVTKQEVKNTFGIDFDTLDALSSDKRDMTVDQATNDEILELIRVFYKDDYNKIGVFSFIDTYIVQDVDNYYARKAWKCTKCDEFKFADSEICPKCGSEDFVLKDIEEQTILMPEIINKTITLEGQPQVVPQIKSKEIKVPYYTPDSFPIVKWDNVSCINSFLATSDIEIISDQQDDINIYMTVIREKTLKGGSIMTVPDDTYIKMNNEQFKVVPISNPADADKFNLINQQVNVQWDLQLQELNYKIGRETLGITNSFQGRNDSTAPSAKAKMLQVDRVSARLSSKQVMRDAAYVKLYNIMFKLILANADHLKYYTVENDDGEISSKLFDKRLFLEKDAYDNYYYDDEMIISIDQTSTIMQDRISMWEIVTNDFMSGVYGDPSDWNTIYMLWKHRLALNYPNAREMLEYAKQMVDAQQAAAEEQAILAKEETALKLAMQQQLSDTKKTLADASSKRVDSDIKNNARAETRADIQAAFDIYNQNQANSSVTSGSTNKRRTGNKTNQSMTEKL